MMPSTPPRRRARFCTETQLPRQKKPLRDVGRPGFFFTEFSLPLHDGENSGTLTPRNRHKRAGPNRG